VGHEELLFGEPDGLFGAGLIASRNEIDGTSVAGRIGGAVVLIVADIVVDELPVTAASRRVATDVGDRAR
jgi:hypothetical protein